MTTLDVLKQARTIIADQARWTTGYVCDEKGRVCAMGAVGLALGWPEQKIAVAMHEEFAQEPAIRELAKTTGDHATDPAWAVEIFNDITARAGVERRSAGHHAVVLDLFDRTIARVSEHEGVEPLPPLEETPAVAAEINQQQESAS